MQKIDRKVCFECPVCKQNIYFGVEHVPQKARCDQCHTLVDIPQEKLAETVLYKSFSQKFMKP